MNHRHCHLTFCLLVLVVGCTSKTPGTQWVAKVAGQGITRAEFDKHLEQQKARYYSQGQGLSPGAEVRLKETLLQEMIEDKIIEVNATTLGLVLSAEAMAAAFDEYKAKFANSEALQAHLTRSNKTLDDMHRELRRDLLRESVIEKQMIGTQISDEDVAKYYEVNKTRFRENAKVKAARILIRSKITPKMTPEQRKVAEKEASVTAASVYARLRKRGAQFDVLAKKYSDGPEQNSGGALGWVPREQRPPPFDQHVFNLEPGEFSAPFKTREGFEIVKPIGILMPVFSNPGPYT